eukprot:10665563-Ditylum_brightwellii.AAC.2
MPVAPEASAAVSTTTSESHETMIEDASSSSAADAVDHLLHQTLSVCLTVAHVAKSGATYCPKETEA